MKKIYTLLLIALFTLLTFSSCSKEPTEPYYDRANLAADKAHNKLSKD